MARTMPGMIMKVALESMDKLVEEKEALRADLVAVAMAAVPFRDGYDHDLGQCDLDNEQPIRTRVSIGDWKELRVALARPGVREALHDA